MAGVIWAAHRPGGHLLSVRLPNLACYMKCCVLLLVSSRGWLTSINSPS